MPLLCIIVENRVPQATGTFLVLPIRSWTRAFPFLALESFKHFSTTSDLVLHIIFYLHFSCFVSDLTEKESQLNVVSLLLMPENRQIDRKKAKIAWNPLPS